MTSALWLLIGLQARGWLRYVGRNVTTVKGALLALLGLILFVPWLLTLALSGPTGRGGAAPYSPEQIRQWGPLVLLAYCLANVLMSAGERAVYFSPAEVQFLFTGPFGRRQLLGYKIVSALLLALPSTLFMMVVLRVYARWWLAEAVGVFLLFTFMQLFGMVLNLAAVSLGARLFSLARRGVAVAAAAVAVGLFFAAGGQSALQDPARLWASVQGPLRVLTWPLGWFFEAFLADTWAALVPAALAAAAVDAAVVGAVFALDADYLEATADSSARLYARLQRLRGRKLGDEGVPEAGGATARWALPLLTVPVGVGPTLWRQLTTALRQPSRMGILALVFVIMLGALVLGGSGGARASDDAGVAVGWVVLFFLLFLTLFLTNLVPFDFRGDLDRMALLKTLPVPGWRLALGQVLGPALVMTLIQWLVLAALAGLQSAGAGPGGVLATVPLLLGFAAFAPAINFLVFGLENLLFLLFPSRLAAGGGPGDFQAMGRQFLFYVAKMCSLGVAGLLAFVVAAGVYFLAGHYALLALAAGWGVVAAAGAATIPLVALAFDAFDVGRDTPP